MSAAELIEELHGRGIRLWEQDGALRFRAPRGALTDDLRAVLRERRSEVLAVLSAGPAPLEHDAAGRYEPFPLTDVQSAYLIGRHDGVGHDGVACHVYLEKTYPDRDPDRLADAWRRIVAHHDMLRVVFTEDGSQRVLATGPDPTPRVLDLRGRTDGEVGAARDAVRSELAESVHDPASGRMHELVLTRADDDAVLHVSIDFLVADWSSISRVLTELDTLHDDPGAAPAPAAIGFRDYVLAEQRELDSPAHQEDRRYWWDRIDDLPAAPELPRSPRPVTTGPAFRRHRLRLDRTRWQALTARARARGVTPSTAVLAAYASVIGRWSRRPSFCLNLTLLGRQPRHPDVAALVGDFTSVSLLQVDDAAPPDLATLARAVGARLFDDLDHRSFSGLRVMRELARRRGREAALMPVVFTSAIGLDAGAGTGAGGDSDRHGISQTPQVVVDCQVVDDAEGLSANWDVREGVLPDGVAEDMVAAFLALLEALADTDDAWDAAHDAPLPAHQRRARDRVNTATGPAPQGLLQDGFLRWAAARPRHPAVVGAGATLDYGELEVWARHTAGSLVTAGVRPGTRVAVVMDKGPEQVVAVLAVLLAGASYVPVDAAGPPERRAATLDAADVAAVVTQSWVAAPDAAPVVVVDLAAGPAPHPAAAAVDPASPDDVAYVIYTSGSTGRPKGVVVTHRAARTTIDDVLVRFGIGADDRALGLAALGFDLSVHDVFGTLAAGGTLVLPDPARGADPSHWGDLVAEHRITVWNSVPAQMTMLVTMLESTGRRLGSLRVVLLSGDWIPPVLPDRIRATCPGAAPVSLGGATEAAIWSIHHRIGAADPDWPSVPYGVPLDRQGFRVLDAAGRDRPDWVAGELVITGEGLAVGYHGDPALTDARFVHDRDGTRMYRTGDVGRYRPGGILEFLGREDTQVKIRGHRIELGEVEAALAGAPGVGEAVAVLDADPGPDADPRLVAAVVPTAVDPTAVDPTAGQQPPVDRDAVEEHLRARLPAAAVPGHLLVLDALPVTGNGKIDRALLRRLAQEQAPHPDDGRDEPAGEAPRDEVERDLAGHAAALLSLPSVGRAANLYDLGADSLVMARLVGRWREQVGPAAAVPFDVLLRRLLNSPTVAAAAELVRPRSTEVPATAPRGEGLAELVWFSPPPAGPDEPVRVLFHAGFGTMDCFATLAARLVAQDRGPTVGIALGDAEAYCALASAQVVPRAADDHTRSLLASGARRFQLVGYCIGGLFAAEVASRLAEQGAEVVDLTLVDAMPMPFVVDDELFVENAFVPSLGLDPIRSVWGGVDPADLWRAVDRVTAEHRGRLPDGALASVSGDPGLEAVAAAVARARARSQPERLAAYAHEAAGGTPHSPEAIPALFRTFRQSLRASGHRAEPWDGDAAFLRPGCSESASGAIGSATLAYWRDVVLGELSVVDVGGDHLSCVEDPHVDAVADVLAARLSPG